MVVPRPDFEGKRAYLYGRVSREDQLKLGYSLGDQQNRLRAEAAQLGCLVVGESFEQGSGQDWELAGVVDLETRARRGEFDLLLVKDTSRLSRSSAKAAYLSHVLERAGVLIHFTDENFEPTPEGRLLKGFMQNIAEYELEKTRRRTIEGAQRKVALGRPLGHGHTPYGWRRIFDSTGRKTVGYEHEPAECEVLRRICRELMDASLHTVCDRLNAEGIPSPGKFVASERRARSGRWIPGVIAKILNSSLLWGEYRYGQLVKVNVDGKRRAIPTPEDTWTVVQLPPIVDRQEVERVRKALAERQHKRRGRVDPADDQFVLRGLLTCGECGGALHTSTGKARDGGLIRYYRCLRSDPYIARKSGKDGCTFPRMRATVAEQYVRDTLLSTLGNPDHLRTAIQEARDPDGDSVRRAERIAVVGAIVKRDTAALERAVMDYARAESESERAAFGTVKNQLARQVDDYNVELHKLEAWTPTGLTVDDEAALMGFSGQVERGFANLEPSELRQVCELLRLRGVARVQEEGPIVGGLHQFALILTGAVPIYAPDAGVATGTKSRNSASARNKISTSLG
jgi:DNA invertase Pin-like site-specific DNA recombinase